ncbi:MAG: Gfo/Idh/MocA family oxidoreductase [Opitutaceae bacterium]
MTRNKIVIIGCGSIGERHLRAFLANDRIGVIAAETQAGLRERIATTHHIEAVADYRDLLRRDDVVAALVATPAPSHVSIATHVLESGRHVLIEKPLSLDQSGLDQLVALRDASKRVAAVAYVYHFIPAVVAARDFIRQGSFGPVLHATVACGQHFPTYRPAYRDIYYARKESGGGAIQDALTHIANAVDWTLGPATTLVAEAAHQCLEGVAVEDTVNVLTRQGRALVSYQLNQFQSPNEIVFDFHSAGGSVRIEIHHQRWGTFAHGAGSWTWHDSPVPDRDFLFQNQARAFVEAMEGRPTRLATLEEGIRAVAFNQAAFQSIEEGRKILL